MRFFSIYPVMMEKIISAISTTAVSKINTRKPVSENLTASSSVNITLNFSTNVQRVHKWNRLQETIFANVYKSSILKQMVVNNTNITSERSVAADKIETSDVKMKMMLMFLMGIIHTIPLMFALAFAILRFKKKYGKSQRHPRAIR